MEKASVTSNVSTDEPAAVAVLNLGGLTQTTLCADVRIVGLITDGRMEFSQSAPLPPIRSVLLKLIACKSAESSQAGVCALVPTDPAESGSSGKSRAGVPRGGAEAHPPLPPLPPLCLHPASRTALGIARHQEVAAVTSGGPGCRRPSPSPGPGAGPAAPELQRTDSGRAV